MKIVALIEKEGWMARDLRRAAALTGHEMQTARWSDLRGRVGGDDAVRAGDVNLSAADAVLLRTIRIGTFEQVFFRLDVLHRLEASGVAVINPPRSIEVSVDKYVALAHLREAGLRTPDTVACQKYRDALDAFDELGGDVVIKLLFGSEGFGIGRVSERVMAQRAFSQLERMGAIAYVQQFVPHGREDYRVFVLGDRVLAAIRRHGVDWRSNVALGGRPEPLEPSGALASIALRSARACGTLVAGVDVVFDRAGRPFVLEVNAIPGWKALAPATGIDVARAVIEYVAQRVGARDEGMTDPLLSADDRC